MATGAVTHHRPWGWFAAWLLVGAACIVSLLGAFSIGSLVLPIALAGTALVAWRSSLRGVPGVIAGLGLPPLYVAYLNRAGPGSVCSAITRGQDCIQEFNPWPWLIAGCSWSSLESLSSSIHAQSRADDTASRPPPQSPLTLGYSPSLFRTELGLQGPPLVTWVYVPTQLPPTGKPTPAPALSDVSLTPALCE